MTPKSYLMIQVSYKNHSKSKFNVKGLDLDQIMQSVCEHWSLCPNDHCLKSLDTYQVLKDENIHGSNFILIAHPRITAKEAALSLAVFSRPSQQDLIELTTLTKDLDFGRYFYDNGGYESLVRLCLASDCDKPSLFYALISIGNIMQSGMHMPTESRFIECVTWFKIAS